MNFLRLFRHPKALKDLGPDEILRLLDSDPGVRVVDVRSPGEYRRGHIRGAVLGTLGETAAVVGDWPRDTRILLICHSGHRSQAAAHDLIAMGFTDLSHLDGGMMAWARHKAPLVQG